MGNLTCGQWIGSEWNVTQRVGVLRCGNCISQTGRIGDLSDEITGMPVICEYTFRPVDICSFLPAKFPHRMLSQSQIFRELSLR